MNNLHEIAFTPAIELDTKYVSDLVQEMKKHLANAQRLHETTESSTKKAEELCELIQLAAAEGDFDTLTRLNTERLVHEQKTGATRRRGQDSIEKLEKARFELVKYLIDIEMPVEKQDDIAA